jgi:hypothetical protein
VILFDLGFINNIRCWQWTGNITKSVFPQIQERHPAPATGILFIIRDMPTTERGVFLFDVGLNQMIQLGYHRTDIYAAHENEINLIPGSDQLTPITLTWSALDHRFVPDQ